MSLQLYLTIQQFIMSGILALGCHLIFAPIPNKLKHSRIHISGRIIGVAMSILPITSYIYFFFNLVNLGPQYATAMNLTAYCIILTLIALAYYVLLEHIEDKTFTKIHLSLGLIYPIPLWIGLCYGSEFIIKHILIVSYTVFCVLAIIHISTCFYFYRQRYKRSKDKMSDMDYIESKLIGRTIYVSMVMIFVGIFSAAFFSYPMWLGLLFISYFVGGAIYIYICYYKILYSNINSLIQANEEYLDCATKEEINLDAASASIISDETRAHIEEYLKKWISKKQFLQQTTSITSVAQELCTNRTYLSRYINSVYHCSFKSWITQLRIEEAKRLMEKHPTLTISDIAKQTGFASVESFSHIFTRNEGQAPSKWREKEHGENNTTEAVSCE